MSKYRLDTFGRVHRVLYILSLRRVFGMLVARVSAIAIAAVFYSIVEVSLAQNPPRVDDRWYVTINGQTAHVGAGGAFQLGNIAAADFFGALGPGSPPDFRSDDWMQALATASIDGVTWYAYSEPFQIVQDPAGGVSIYHIQTMAVSRRPPANIPEAISIELVESLDSNTLWLNGDGGPVETEIRVIAAYPGVAPPRDVTGPSDGTTYRVSNLAVAQLEEKGGAVHVRAAGIGTAFITATNHGATAVRRFVVTAPCIATQLSGRVETAEGEPVSGVLVSTEDGANDPPGTGADGTFLFEVCVRPGEPMTIVAVHPPTNQKGLRAGVLSVPNGVTDVGAIVLEGDILIWSKNEDGDWSGSWNALPSPWHTGGYPGASSHVVINGEAWQPPPFPDEYTVKLGADTTIAKLTLDSSRALLTTPDTVAQTQFTLLQTAQLLSGTLAWHQAAWKGGTLQNAANVRVSGGCYFGEGVQVINNGGMNIEFDDAHGSLFVVGQDTAFRQSSTTHELLVEGRVYLQDGAAMTTTPSCKGIEIGPTGLLELRGSGGVSTSLDHLGGTISIREFSPGLLVDMWGKLRVDGGFIEIEPNTALRAGGAQSTIDLVSGTILNAGTFHVHDGARLNFHGGSIVAAGGDETTVLIEQAGLNINPLATAPAEFRLRRICTLAGTDGPSVTIPPTQTIVIQGFGENSSGDAIVLAAGDLSNQGVLVLDSVATGASAADAWLLVDPPGTLTNDGQMLCNGNMAGERIVDTRFFVNHATMDVAAPTLLRFTQPDAPSYTNFGTILIRENASLRFDPIRAENCIALTNARGASTVGLLTGSGLLHMGHEILCGSSGERTLENAGVVNPGGQEAPGSLTIAGSYRQTNTGTLVAELGGTQTGQSDQLAVMHTATLAGTLIVNVLPAFAPNIGDQFDVLTYTGRTGSFENVQGLNLGADRILEVTYLFTSLRLTVRSADLYRPRHSEQVLPGRRQRK